MSVPYGPPQGFPPGPQGPPPPSGPGPDLGKIFALVAGGLALIFFFFSFSDDVRFFAGSLSAVLVFAGGLLAAGVALPGAPKTLIPATVITTVGTLTLLVNVVKGPLGTEGADTPGLVIVVLIVAFLVLIACVVALLFETGMMASGPKASPFPQPGGFPGQQFPGQQPVGPPSGGFPAQQPQSGGFPQQQGVPAHNPTQVTPGYGQQPGQYGPPPGF